MNKRIRELAEQAEREVYPVTVLYKDEGAPRLNAQFEQKFAELIVEECADFLTDDLDYPDAALKLKERFGVEE